MIRVVSLKILWESRHGAERQITLTSAECGLADLVGFEHLLPLAEAMFAHGGGPWLPVSTIKNWLKMLQVELEAQVDVLSFRYGADGDYAGGESVRIRGETWALSVGWGECSLSQSMQFVKVIAPGYSRTTGRRTKWIDLRLENFLQADDRVIKLSRRRVEVRWYQELPGLLEFLEGVSEQGEIRARVIK